MQVLMKTPHQQRDQFNLTNDGVAATAEKPANHPGAMIVVNDKCPICRVTEQALTSLLGTHPFDINRRETVLPHQASAEILSLRCAWVGATPFTQPFISALAVGLTIRAVSAARALTALAPFASPVSERLINERAEANATCQHLVIMPCSTNTHQPCHADVLLEWANS